jgi:trehalose 6-phosphate synthase
MTIQELAGKVAAVSNGAKLVVASNREPFVHEQNGSGLRVVRPASGMVTAIDPIVKAVGGTWVAHGSGSADRLAVDTHDRLLVPPESHKYTLRRVWLSPEEEEGYYHGLSNGALWPLCHIAYTRPEFRKADWEMYRAVNLKFCDAILEETEESKGIVFIQDYQLGLLARMLKERRPDLIVMQFWHIPWPNREAFRIFPWGDELLDGLLGNDLLGFHIQYHCNNFMETVDRSLESKVDYEHFCISRGGRRTYVRPFPISVDFDQIGADVGSAIVQKQVLEIKAAIGEQPADCRVFVGVERIDYTKGLLERLQALDKLLQNQPELKRKVILLQLAAPSRMQLDVYRDLNDRIEAMVQDINTRHRTDGWQPVHFLKAHHDYYAVLAAYTIGDVLLATSLHDGMNLVAKEYVAARSNSDGILILSEYTGAAREMPDAIQVNPFDIEQVADAMFQAYHMPDEEVHLRMRRMREHAAKENVYVWGTRVFDELHKILPA